MWKSCLADSKKASSRSTISAETVSNPSPQMPKTDIRAIASADAPRLLKKPVYDIWSYFQSDAGGQFGSVMSPISGYTGAAYFLIKPARPSVFSSGERLNGNPGSIPGVRRTGRPLMYRMSCNCPGGSQESNCRPKRRAYLSVRSFVSAIDVAPTSAYRLSANGWRI